MPPSRLTWAALFSMVASTGCFGSTGESCDTDSLPSNDPCYMRGCCETVNVIPLPDGGVEVVPDGVDGGPDVQQRFCGACNG